eukprot:CAMPEP_0180005574 /NCGR_PEP_ID=MMETSP0984-20121128/12776_1 /TAXON_ID=483367 /ORGANISM="non described non described, Strain CCMP 2436" /LENGTH=122 /DNA_ID=CAMNT_0021926311 /DNA_START=26 /DNA_END=392 /DNA_ORIENTATION=-
MAAGSSARSLPPGSRLPKPLTVDGLTGLEDRVEVGGLHVEGACVGRVRVGKHAERDEDGLPTGGASARLALGSGVCLAAKRHLNIARLEADHAHAVVDRLLARARGGARAHDRHLRGVVAVA